MRRVAVMVLLIGALGLLGVRHLLPGRRAESGPASPTSEPLPRASSVPVVRPGLVAIVAECAPGPDSLVASGWVRNGLELTVRYVEIMVTWLDTAGSTVEDDYLTVVGAETLMPGDSARFRLSTPAPGATGCAAEVFAYDPIF